MFKFLSIIIYIKNKKKTFILGLLFVKIIIPSLKIFLIGNLGLGKTTLSKSFIYTLITKRINIKSPTYNLIEKYKFKNIVIYHCDFYRVKNLHDFYKKNLFFSLKKKYITIIEWGEKILYMLSFKKILLHLYYYSKHYDRIFILNSNISIKIK